MFLRPSMRPLRPAATLSLGELVASMRNQSRTDREAVAKVVQLIQQGRVAIPGEAGERKRVKIGV